MTKMSDQQVVELKNYIVTQLQLRAEPEETIHALIKSVLNWASSLVSSANLTSETVKQWREQWNRGHCAISQQQAIDLFALATKAMPEEFEEQTQDDNDDDEESMSRTGGDDIQYMVPLPSAVFTGGWVLDDDNDLDLSVPVPWPPASAALWLPPVASCDPTSDGDDMPPPTLWDSEEYEEDSDDEDPIHI